jgi:dienelactone hydrolase
VNPNCCAIHIHPDITLYHSGPPLDLGPLPSFFYFSLSGTDSLTLDPFNQPVQFLQGKMIRVFSMTLPGHENGLPPTEAIQLWADDYARGRNPIDQFLDTFAKALDFAIEKNFVNPEKMGVGGLSRGGFIALHAAARNPKLKYVVAFAPITKLHKVKEFASLQDDPKVRALDLEQISPLLTHSQIRIYIGNRDILVSTQSSFDFVMSVVEAAHEKNVRSAKIEYFLHPSIGHKGHGTAPEIFRNGADWISSCLQ